MKPRPVRNTASPFFDPDARIAVVAVVASDRQTQRAVDRHCEAGVKDGTVFSGLIQIGIDDELLAEGRALGETVIRLLAEQHFGVSVSRSQAAGDDRRIEVLIVRVAQASEDVEFVRVGIEQLAA